VTAGPNADLLMWDDRKKTGAGNLFTVFARELSLATSNAQQAIDRLVGDGVLRLIGKGARDRAWEAPEVISALGGFAKRAKRRTA
jgi:hypothetical protein